MRGWPAIRFAVPHPAQEAATNLLASMIFTGRVKEKYKASVGAAFRAEPGAATALLARTYGQAHASFLAEAGAQEQWEAIENRTGELRRVLIVRQLAARPVPGVVCWVPVAASSIPAAALARSTVPQRSRRRQRRRT